MRWRSVESEALIRYCWSAPRRAREQAHEHGAHQSAMTAAMPAFNRRLRRQIERGHLV